MANRPDPDKLLKHLQAEEKSSSLGRLKLFFGANPGVGKTYAMLEAARQRKKEGWDVVVGLVETHGRTETEALLEGFEILPRKEVSYKNVALKEFDLDAALKRRPRLILVDELAHSNAPGSRHAKRWQDIEELLDAGIDVYTTLNVQHWETLNDVVAQITSVTVHETVPDSFLQRAHELELVDLAPEDLLKRLKDGKVYKGDLAGQASEHFFKPGNLIALRELALRHAAERVDVQMQAYKEQNSIGEVWPVGERLLVGVSASPLSIRLIRTASRLATRLKAPWIAVLVETPGYLRLTPKERGRAINNLRMAKKLGAETLTLTGDNVTDELVAFARSRNVTQIILGKPTRRSWLDWFSGSIVDDMARRCGDIDLHVISGPNTPSDPDPTLPSPEPARWKGVGVALAMVLGATLLCWPLLPFLDRANLVMIYLLAVVITAYQFGRRIAFLASFLSVLAFDFFFVPPYFTFAVGDTEYVLTFLIMLSVGLVISTITGRLRSQTNVLRERARRMRELYKLSRNLSETPDVPRMMGAAASQLEEFYNCPILLLTPGPQGQLDVAAGNTQEFVWNVNERSVAQWVFDKAQMAGAGSDTLSGAGGLYFPLKGLRGTAGVLGLRPNDAKSLLAPEQVELLETFASVIGGALESTRMSEGIGRAEREMELQALKSGKEEPSLKISTHLSPERILILEPGLMPTEILRQLLGRMSLPNHAQAFQAITEREKAGPTEIGEFISIPHARIPGLKGIELALGLTTNPSPHIWLVFLSPAEDPKLHLTFLAALAAFFKKENRAADITSLSSSQDILKYIHQSEA